MEGEGTVNLDQNYLKYNNAMRTAELYQKKLRETEKLYGGFKSILLYKQRIKQILQRPMDEVREHQLYKYFDEIGRAGLNNSEKRDKKIIVTMTSYPARINKTPAAIASLLKQTVKPDKIILWLANEDFPDRKLPVIYNKIRNCGVEIKFRPDLKVHMKWYYALSEYPEALVITVDDDIMYENKIVEQLYDSYKKFPKDISALGVDRIRFDDNANILRYEEWIGGYTDTVEVPSHQLFAAGVAGVLYPPYSLPDEAFNQKNLRKLSPTNDDLWLKFMEVIHGTRVVAVGGAKIRRGQFSEELSVI